MEKTLLEKAREIRDEIRVKRNTSTRIGNLFLDLINAISENIERIDQINKILCYDDTIQGDETVFLSLKKRDATWNLGVRDGEAYLDCISSEGNEYDIKNKLITKDDMSASLKEIIPSQLVQEGALWVTPAIQLSTGNAQIQITTSTATTITVARSNTPLQAFSDIRGWSEVANTPSDVFNISGGVAGMYIKLKFSVKPISISVLS